MTRLVQKKEECIRLRRLGLSYGDIQKKIPVSKGSLSLWFKDISFTQEEIVLIKRRESEQIKNRTILASKANVLLKTEREKKIYETAKEEFKKYARDKFFFTGLSLYWAQGGKGSGTFQFMSADPDMVMLMIKWIDKFLNISKNGLRYRVFATKLDDMDQCVKFWSQLTGISREKFYKTAFVVSEGSKRRNLIYRGRIMINTGGIQVLRKVTAWQKLLIKYYMKV